jgi:general secretion pathway protein J
MKHPMLIVRRTAPWSPAGGFTLLELTISITLIGLIVLIVVGALRLGHRSVESGEKKIAVLERIRSSFQVIDSQLQSYIPLSYEENGEIKYYFKGERDSIRFTTNYSIWGGAKGYVIAVYSVIPENEGRQVLYASESVIGMEGRRETKLFDNFESIYFEYFFRDPTEEYGRWVDRWAEEVSTPEKVRLHFIGGGKEISFILPLRVRGLPEDLVGRASLREIE